MIAWEDNNETQANDIETTLKKDGRFLFCIVGERDCYTARYNYGSMLVTPRISYLKTAQLAREKFGEDSLENRLEIAKEFFIDDYKRQISDLKMVLNLMSIDDETF